MDNEPNEIPSVLSDRLFGSQEERAEAAEHTLAEKSQPATLQKQTISVAEKRELDNQTTWETLQHRMFGDLLPNTVVSSGEANELKLQKEEDPLTKLFRPFLEKTILENAETFARRLVTGEPIPTRRRAKHANVGNGEVRIVRDEVDGEIWVTEYKADGSLRRGYVEARA